MSDDGNVSPDKCPVCGAKTWVSKTWPSGLGVVVRIRDCTKCTARFYTTEKVFRVTTRVAERVMACINDRI